MSDSEGIEDITREQKERAEVTLRNALQRTPERRDQFVTASGAPIERLYSRIDLAGRHCLVDYVKASSPRER